MVCILIRGDGVVSRRCGGHGEIIAVMGRELSGLMLGTWKPLRRPLQFSGAAGMRLGRNRWISGPETATFSQSRGENTVEEALTLSHLICDFFKKRLCLLKYQIKALTGISWSYNLAEGRSTDPKSPGF